VGRERLLEGARPADRADARYEDAAAAIDWLHDAFGFTEDPDQRYTEPDGTVSNAELQLDGAPPKGSTVAGVSTGLAHVIQLGVVDYREALDLQRSVASQVADGTLPDTVLFLEHPPTITLGRRTEEGEVHVPDGAAVDVVEVDRGGKSTYHAPGQLVCYPILDLTRHGQDVKQYCRNLEEALIRTMATFGIEATRIEGLTGVWLESPPRKIASIGIHLSKWISTHGYALNVDLDPAPFTDWITACGLDGYAFTSMARELGRPLSVDDVRPAAAQAFADVFGLAFQELPVKSVAQTSAA
jgi:lipoyl(octanoyl) transferase